MAREGSALLQPALAQTDWCDAFTQRGLFTLLPGELRCERHGRVALAPFTLAWDLGPGACCFVPDRHQQRQPVVVGGSVGRRKFRPRPLAADS